uniref:Transmembrane protein 161B-like n=1 Tax=Phallusia mammillata TaxID=59560 RepID=A0A6F9DVP3_9ASCI|nr:transmembrane protein 161B-like [Phallusia mammillata]
MAIFGFQICFTLIMASFLQKITPIYSLGRWLLGNGSLIWYRFPSDQELRKAAGKPLTKKENGKLKHRRQNKSLTPEDETFKIPKNIDITLDVAPVFSFDLATLKNYSDFEWLVNYTLFGCLVYILTELYYEVWVPEKEFNISMVWVALSLWFAFRNLFSIFWMYVKSRAGGEISMSIVFGMISFILALASLMVKEETLEFGLHDSLQKNVSVPVNSKPVSSVKLLLASWSCIVGLLFMFPAVRMAQMYVDALKYASGRKLKTLALHINFFAPGLIALLWVKPVARDVIMKPTFSKTQDVEPLLTDGQFDIIRIIIVLLTCLLRLFLIRTHLQAYLNLAYVKVLKLKKESGLITNTEFQRTIYQIFYYVGIVATQYISPLVFLLCSAMFVKTLGGYSWFSLDSSHEDAISHNFNASTYDVINENDSHEDMVQKMKENIHALQLIFTPIFLRGVLSYMLWWIASNWFLASCVGLLYHSYLTE